MIVVMWIKLWRPKCSTA